MVYSCSYTHGLSTGLLQASIHVSQYMSIHTSIHMSIHMSMDMSIHTSIDMPIHIFHRRLCPGEICIQLELCTVEAKPTMPPPSTSTAVLRILVDAAVVHPTTTTHRDNSGPVDQKKKSYPVSENAALDDDESAVYPVVTVGTKKDIGGVVRPWYKPKIAQASQSRKPLSGCIPQCPLCLLQYISIRLYGAV